MSKEPWIDALAAKRQIITNLETPHAAVLMTPKSIEREIKNLKIAEVYSFSGSALGAIQQGSRSVPGDTMLDASHCPRGGAGWWWFDNPLIVKSSDWLKDLPIVALSWNFYVSVSKEDFTRMRLTGETAIPLGEKSLASQLTSEQMVEMELDGDLPFVMEFTAYIKDEVFLPAITWRWSGQSSMENMVEHCRIDGEQRGTDTTVIGPIRDLSAFFVAAMTWINQEILEVAPMTVRVVTAGSSRSEKRRSPRYPVNVIQLRRRHFLKGAENKISTDSSTREWHCQWVVSGHWRNQPYGPARLLRRLMYINPYVKGPEDMPIKETRPKVFAVMR